MPADPRINDLELEPCTFGFMWVRGSGLTLGFIGLRISIASRLLLLLLRRRRLLRLRLLLLLLLLRLRTATHYHPEISEPETASPRIFRVRPKVPPGTES